MSNGRWQKYSEDNRNYSYSPNDRNDRNRYLTNNINRYFSGRPYLSNDYRTMQALPQHHRNSSIGYSSSSRHYESTSDYSRRKSDYYDSKESQDKYISRDPSKDMIYSSTTTNIPEKIIVENNDENKKDGNSKSESKSPGNKRLLSTNVLSIEEAVKLSNNEKESDEQQPGIKKRKLSSNQEDIDDNNKNKNEDVFHSHLKDIQTCKKDLLDIKSQIKSKIIVLKQMKTQYINECDLYKELQIKRKTLSKKVKKMCKALAEVDDEDKLDNEAGGGGCNQHEDVEIVDALNEITTIISVGSNSDEDSCSSSGSSVQFVNETVTINNEDNDDDEVEEVEQEQKEQEREPEGGKESSTHSNNSKNNKSVSSNSVTPSSKSTTNHTNNFINKIEYKLTSDVIKSPRLVNDQSSEKSIKLNRSATTTTTSTNQITTETETAAAAVTNQIKPSVETNKSPIKEKSVPKIELVGPATPRTSIKLENVVNKETTPTTLKLDFPLNFKPDAMATAAAAVSVEFNCLYNEIEPKLNTIVISDEDKTFIADIKIFNNRLFVGASHGLLRQYHLGTQECIRDYKGHASLVHCILPTIYPIGINRLISGGLDKIVLIHDIDTGLLLNKIEEDSSIFSICDHLDFVYYGTVNGNVSTFSLEKNRKMSSFSASTCAISCLTATKDGNNHILFVGTNEGEYSMWDAITYTKLKVINPVSHREIPIGFVLLQKQRILAFSKNYVHFINYVKTKSSTIFNHFDPMVSICLTKNYIIIGAICGKISVYKVKSSTIQKIPIRTIFNSSSPIISLTFYNNTIISGDKNGKVYFNRLVEDKSL